MAKRKKKRRDEKLYGEYKNLTYDELIEALQKRGRELANESSIIQKQREARKKKEDEAQV